MSLVGFSRVVIILRMDDADKGQSERQVTDLNLPTPASLSHANPSATPSTPSVGPDDATAARETSGSADEAKT